MADLAMGGLGLAGLLALFQTCNRAYDVFIRSAKNLGKDAHRLGVNLEVERQKLRLWGQYLGISSAGQCRLLRTESFETQKLAIMLLETIKTILDDIDIIMLRYGVNIVEDSAEPGARTSAVELEGLNLDDIRNCDAIRIASIKREKTENSIVASASRVGKIRWALNDSKKLDRLVQDLRKINEDLWVSLPVNQWLALAKGLPSVVLPGMHDQSMLLEIGGNARGKESTELLAACSEMRRAALTAASEESKPCFGNELIVQPESITRSIPLSTGDSKIPTEAQRQIAVIADESGLERQVIVEWRYIDRSFNPDERKTAFIRIKSLAVLLSTERSTELGLLKCIGFYKDNSNTVIERYALVFEVRNSQLDSPTPHNQIKALYQLKPRSLYELMRLKQAPPLLGDRFRIASALCNTVLQLHASSWLHKAIRSSNILFFPKPFSETIDFLDSTHGPFIMGFDYSRPDRPAVESLDIPGNRSFNDYRHPALWATSESDHVRYRKEFDIHALGVVLLEIGIWKLVRTIDDEHRDPQNPEKWKTQLLKWVEGLGYRCGKIYQEIVITCLTGSFAENDLGTSIIGPQEGEAGFRNSFLFDVVYKLGHCSA